jgi:hypothetical protein
MINKVSRFLLLVAIIADITVAYAGREAVAGGEGLVQKGLLTLALLAVVAFLLRLIRRLRQKPTVSIRELKQCLDAGEDLLVLDVRSAEDFVGEQGHITRTTNIPLEELPDRLAELECRQLSSRTIRETHYDNSHHPQRSTLWHGA